MFLSKSFEKEEVYVCIISLFLIFIQLSFKKNLVTRRDKNKFKNAKIKQSKTDQR